MLVLKKQDGKTKPLLWDVSTLVSKLQHFGYIPASYNHRQVRLLRAVLHRNPDLQLACQDVIMEEHQEIGEGKAS